MKKKSSLENFKISDYKHLDVAELCLVKFYFKEAFKKDHGRRHPIMNQFLMSDYNDISDLIKKKSNEIKNPVIKNHDLETFTIEDTASIWINFVLSDKKLMQRIALELKKYL